jgi:hypothetical protein
MMVFARAAVVILLAMVFAESAIAGEIVGPGFVGTFPFYSGDYPYYEGIDPPHPLYAPYGFYGCRAGCCRQAVWRGRHWRDVVSCAPVSRIRPNAVSGLQ